MERQQPGKLHVAAASGSQREASAKGSDTLALGYLALAVPAALSAVACFLAPGVALGASFQGVPVDAPQLQRVLMQLFAAGAAVVATSAWVLRGAALEGTLGVDTHRRLQLGLVWWAVLGAIAFRQHAHIVTPLAATGQTVTILTTLLVAGLPYWRQAGTLNPVEMLQRFLGNFQKLLVIRDVRGLIDFFLIISVFAAGAAYWVAPEQTLTAVLGAPAGEAGVFLWKWTGAALIGPLHYLLFNTKELADLGQSKDGVSIGVQKRQLLGAAATAAAHVAALGPLALRGAGGSLLVPLLGTWVVGLITALNCLVRGKEEK